MSALAIVSVAIWLEPTSPVGRIGSAGAQPIGACRTGDARELDESILGHEEHMYRLNDKFLNTYYLWKDTLPDDFSPAGLDDVRRFLEALDAPGTRPSAVLFYAYDWHGRLCTWLITGTDTASHTRSIDRESFDSLLVRIRDALGVSAIETARSPVPRGSRNVGPPPVGTEPLPSLQVTVDEASELLLPAPIRHVLMAEDIGTIIVVPTAAVGTFPFSILRFGNGMLVDELSIVIAPGFFTFTEPPPLVGGTFARPLIVGNPVGWEDPRWVFPPLPGARREAIDVARALGVTALVDSAATTARVENAVAGSGLIYLATHGIGDYRNPRDASFLLLSDGRWPAARIQNLPLRDTRPLVVLSACQTGLGKEFEVGTIGMARAWQRAGASSVIMSLWNVDDDATALLMTAFIRLASALPVQEALRRAMVETRAAYPDPALWAGFAVFGPPQKAVRVDGNPIGRTSSGVDFGGQR